MSGKKLCLLFCLIALVSMVVACTGIQTAQEEAGQENSLVATWLSKFLPVKTGPPGGSAASRIIVYTALDSNDWPVHLESFRQYPELFQRHCPDVAVNPAEIEVEVQEVEGGQLYIYDANQPQCPNLEIQVERASTGDITDRFLAEKGNPRADVIWALATTSLLRAAAEGMLEPYAPAGLDRVSSKMRDFDNPPLFVGTDVFMSAFCVNTEKLAEAGLPMPASWADLTDPVYKNQLIMPDPSSSGTGFIAIAAFLQGFGEEEGWAKLDALHQNMFLYTRSGSQPCKLAGKGQIPIGISFGQAATSQQAQGLRWWESSRQRGPAGNWKLTPWSKRVSLSRSLKPFSIGPLAIAPCRVTPRFSP